MGYDEIITADTSSKIIHIKLRQDMTGANPGNGKTGVASASVGAYYVRDGGTSNVINVIAGTAGDAYCSGKWCEVDSAHMPGVYEFHVPNACLADGASVVTITFVVNGVVDANWTASIRAVDLNIVGGKLPVTLIGADVTGNVPADVKAIGENTTAANNLLSLVGTSTHVAAYQEVAKIFEGCSGSVRFVSVEGADGDDGLTPATAKLTARTVIEAAPAGDVVRLGEGTHALGEHILQIPDGVRVLGAGAGVTVISSTYAGSLPVILVTSSGSGGFSVRGA